MPESDSVSDPLPGADRYAWLRPEQCRDRAAVTGHLAKLENIGVPGDLQDWLAERLRDEFAELDHVDSVAAGLTEFIQAARSPTSLLALFQRDPESLTSLVRMLSTSEVVAQCLIDDPESFDLLRVSGGQAAKLEYLFDELSAELRSVEDPKRAAVILQQFAIREQIRVAYGEFALGMAPQDAGKELSTVADAVIGAALEHSVRRQTEIHGPPARVDGSPPRFAVIGLGNLGGRELTYGGDLDLILLCDQIDRKNENHVAFYQSVAKGFLSLLYRPAPLCFQVGTSWQPQVAPGDLVVSSDEAVRSCEASSQIWRRLAFVRARPVGGAPELGRAFLTGIEAWIYRRFLTRTDLTEMRALRSKMERRILLGPDSLDAAPPGDPRSENRKDDKQRTSGGSPLADRPVDISLDPGGRRDIRLTIRFLQLLHGGEAKQLRVGGTQAAIEALEKTGSITHQEASLLTANYAKLNRLKHHLSIMVGTQHCEVPTDAVDLQYLAWRLGIRNEEQRVGDARRFSDALAEMLQVNRRIINHLMTDPDGGEPADATAAQRADSENVPIETELILDPDPDPAVVAEVLSRHGFNATGAVMDDLTRLATEDSSFLSPRRCRHFFATVAPDLLREIGTTPNPQATLDRLVLVTDSIGAKATLWELLRTSPATLRLMVRLCAGAPYLANVLTGNPGMIDELVDSLVIDRLPSGDRLDAQSITLCRGAVDLDRILRSFKDAAHLTIGVREMLGKENVRQTHRALADTADAVLRRVVEFEQEQLATKFGDPQGVGDTPSAELIALAFGKLGGREPNYHSDLDVLFLYTRDGETKRRIGGPRATTSNAHFFNQLTANVIDHVNRDADGPRLYELDSRLRPTDEDGILSVSIDAFTRRFTQGVAPLWQRLAICKARPVTGGKTTRRRIAARIAEVLRSGHWHPSMIDEVLRIRRSMERTAGQSNFKRGAGGTVDVEMLTQVLLLRHAGSSTSPRLVSETRVTGTLDVLQALAEDDRLSPDDAEQLSENYETLRTIEANLRLMGYRHRHELPEDVQALENLAFLMRTTAADIQSRCRDARTSNRQIFTRLMNPDF